VIAQVMNKAQRLKSRLQEQNLPPQVEIRSLSASADFVFVGAVLFEKPLRVPTASKNLDVIKFTILS
jgi:hypothetical protein